jgi:hypothetical protein
MSTRFVIIQKSLLQLVEVVPFLVLIVVAAAVVR